MERAIILLFPALSFALSLSSFEKPRAILHIGPHQTGSTDLQNNLILNRNVFSQYQYLVLMKNIKSGNAFVNSFAALNGEKRKGERLKKPDLESVLQRIKKKKKSFILSSEEFDTLKQKTINKLGTILKGYNVTILAYHRQKTEHLRSLWALQNKENPSPKEFIPWAEKHILSSSSERTSFGLLPTLDRFSSVFGNESIRLVSFEGSIARSNPFFVLVGDILGLPLHFFKKYFGTTNQSPPTFLMNFVAIASNVSKTDCVPSSNLDKKRKFANITKQIKSLPQICTTLTGWQTLFMNTHDKKLFQKYGKPLYLPEDIPPATTSCTLDFPATLSNLPKSYLFISLIHTICHR